VEAFHRFFDEVAGEHTDLSRYYTPAWRSMFHDELPRAMQRLLDDASPVAQAEASVTYNMIVEGVLAETGYHAYHQAMVDGGILPGMQQVVTYLKRDESRHIAYGVFLLSRLVAEHGDPVWQAIEMRMQGLLMVALQIIQETFDAFGDRIPFGLDRDRFIGIAQSQFMSRFQRIERARTQTLEEVYGEPTAEA
jgi:ribonucleoside-diphosphate reductase beta chain